MMLQTAMLLLFRARFLLLIVGILFGMSSPEPLSAQTPPTPLRLTTSPLPLNLSTTPGKPVATEVRVKNDGLSPERLTLTVLKFKAFEETGAPQLLEPEESDVFVGWVAFSETAFSVAPGEWKTLTATFSPPPEAAFGYYYALIFTRADNPTPLDDKETALLGGTAILALLDVVVPHAKKEIRVEKFSVDKTMYEFLPTAFSVRLKNTGQVHVAPRGNIFINRGSQSDIALLEINPAKGNILPDSHRVFTALWNDGFPLYREKVADGKVVLEPEGRQTQTLHWNFSQADRLRFGKYTAKLLLVYDDGERDVPIEGEVSFWVVPWRIILGGSLVLLLALAGLKSTLQKIWRKFFPFKKK